MKKRKPSREAIARAEIGHTNISPSHSVYLTICFVLLIFAVPLVQLVLDRGEMFGPFMHLRLAEPVISQSGEQGNSIIAAVNYKNKSILKNMHELETRLEEDSFLRKLFLPPLQYALTRFLDRGNEKALSGRNGHLFYAAGIDYLLGQPFLDSSQLKKRLEGGETWEVAVQPDPVAAILHFRDQLSRRGIELLVVPVPVKGAIEPENFVSGNFTRPLRNRSWTRFVSELKSNNVRLFDAGPVLVDYSRRHGGAFLRTDTHWLPGAMENAAEKLAEHIAAAYPQLSEQNGFRLKAASVSGTGDIAGMLTLPEGVKFFPEQQVITNQVLNDLEEYWQPDPDSSILLLGDSFTNIYSFKGLGWGFGAGFAEHLSFRLGRSLDLMARNDSGSYVTREMLAQELLRGRDRLAGKKLVIWEFSERELSSGDWKIIELELKDPVESGFFVSDPGVKIVVTGLVSSISVSPRPGSVPYTDNIVTLHLVEIKPEDERQQMELQQALVYGWGMRDNQLTPLATVRAGDKISLRVTSWEDVEREYGGFRRTPLADEIVELELPNWGELVNE